MKRQADLDKYNPDLQWERMQDKLMWALCIMVIVSTAAYIYRCWQVGELMRMLVRM